MSCTIKSWPSPIQRPNVATLKTSQTLMEDLSKIKTITKMNLQIAIHDTVIQKLDKQKETTEAIKKTKKTAQMLLKQYEDSIKKSWITFACHKQAEKKKKGERTRKPRYREGHANKRTWMGGGNRWAIFTAKNTEIQNNQEDLAAVFVIWQ